MEQTAEFLSDLLSSWLMLVVWGIPFVTSLVFSLKRKDRRLVMIALFCVPFLVYFGWAVTDLWSTHVVALAFNRTAQIFAVAILMMLIYGIYRYEC